MVGRGVIVAGAVRVVVIGVRLFQFLGGGEAGADSIVESGICVSAVKCPWCYLPANGGAL